ncbi:MAG TPA: hypothetical protein PKC32_09545 [Sphingopyxis sp.]|nr:hypothetical protein [Sphingopyxis sp.]
MSDSENWKARSPIGMGLRLLVVFGLFLMGVVEMTRALLTGVIDWPGRGHTELTWIVHPGWFAAAVIGWFNITATMAHVSMLGWKPFLWLMQH